MISSNRINIGDGSSLHLLQRIFWENLFFMIFFPLWFSKRKSNSFFFLKGIHLAFSQNGDLAGIFHRSLPFFPNRKSVREANMGRGPLLSSWDGAYLLYGSAPGLLLSASMLNDKQINCDKLSLQWIIIYCMAHHRAFFLSVSTLKW